MILKGIFYGIQIGIDLTYILTYNTLTLNLTLTFWCRSRSDIVTDKVENIQFSKKDILETVSDKHKISFVYESRLIILGH